MKVLIFVDLHGKTSWINNILKKALKADILVGAGDYTVWGRDLDKIMNAFNALKKPVVVVHGNHETFQDLKNATNGLDNIILAHHKNVLVKGINFFGHGGGGFSDISKSLERVFDRAVKCLKKHPSVFITHEPPWNTKLDIIQHQHVGNITVRNIIEKAKPDLVVTGHLHENHDVVDWMSHSLIVNPGFEGMILNIGLSGIRSGTLNIID